MLTYINYAEADEEFAKRLYTDLYQMGLRPWMRLFDVAPGEDADEQEVLIIEQAGAVLALFTKKYLRDEQLIEYAEAGLALEATVVPLIADRGIRVPEHFPEAVKIVRRYTAGLEEIGRRIPIQDDPLDDAPPFQRGNAAYHNEDYEDAVEHYEAMQNPDARMLHSRAAAYNAIRLHEKALEDANQAIELDDEQPHFYRNRSVAYAGLGQHEEALKDDETALELDPDSLESLSSYAMTLVALQRFDEAKTALEKVIQKAPDSALYRYQMGFANTQAGDLEAALDAFDTALEIDPENESALIARRMVLGQLGRHAEALDEVDKAIRRNPRRASNYLTRSLINFYLEDYNQAADDATEAFMRGGEDVYVPALFNRAIAYWRAEDVDKAHFDFQEAITVMPSLKSESGVRANAESEQTAEAALEILESLRSKGLLDDTDNPDIDADDAEDDQEDASAVAETSDDATETDDVETESSET